MGLLADQSPSGGSGDHRPAPKDADDLGAYLDYLRSVHRDAISVRERSWIDERLGARPRAGKMLDQRPLGEAIRAATSRHSQHDALATYTSAGSIFPEVKTPRSYGQVSPYAEAAAFEFLFRRRYDEFARRLVQRAHFYLMASEVLDAPYKSDALRWPICWQRFGGEDWRGVAAGDRAVQLVEEWEAARLAPLSLVMDKGAICSSTDAVLRAILSTSARPGDVFAATVKIRGLGRGTTLPSPLAAARRGSCRPACGEGTEGCLCYSDFLTRKYGAGRARGRTSCTRSSQRRP